MSCPVAAQAFKGRLAHLLPRSQVKLVAAQVQAKKAEVKFIE
jgi:hypothetical protein